MDQNTIKEKVLRLAYDMYLNPHQKIPGGWVEPKVYTDNIEVDYHEIRTAVEYLLGAGYLEVRKHTDLPCMGRPRIGVTKITNRGIDRVEGASSFEYGQKYVGINIEKIGNGGIVVIGDGNYVYNQFNELANKLEKLKGEIGSTEDISDQDKLNYQAEIETIKSQLAKANPDKTIIAKTWGVLQVLSSFPSLITFLNDISELIRPLLG
ncbi:MAG: hypothetical protein GY771_10515 [bacterium]|nr:hypothetical protein [bacterium]